MMTVKRVVVVGASLGGVTALGVVLSAFPKSFDAAVAIVQHRGDDSGDSLLQILRRAANVELTEAVDKQLLVAGSIVVAPPGYHLLIDDGRCALSTEGRVVGARPSIDVLFESAARSFGRDAAAVVLTSASVDGVKGARLVEASGGVVVVQDPEEAEASCLPAAAIKECRAPRVVLLEGITPCLLREGVL